MAAPADPVLQHLHQLDESSPDFPSQLDTILHGDEYEQSVLGLEREDMDWFVTYLDRVLDNLDPSCPASRKCLRELMGVCGREGILPGSCQIPPTLQITEISPLFSGGFSDFHAGRVGNSPVSIKNVRWYSQGGASEAHKTLCREAVVWKHLNHPNISKFLGVTSPASPSRLVTDWTCHGTLPEYIGKNPQVERIPLISDVAKGLDYLHYCNIIHGNLKGSNVLIDIAEDFPRARIRSFVAAGVTENPESARPDLPLGIYTPRWSAPEVLRGENTSKKSDIFSFAMLMIEVFTGQVPFQGRHDFDAPLAIIKGERPQEPVHPSYTPEMRSLMHRCWNQDPDSRPEASEISQLLSWEPLNQRVQS